MEKIGKVVKDFENSQIHLKKDLMKFVEEIDELMNKVHEVVDDGITYTTPTLVCNNYVEFSQTTCFSRCNQAYTDTKYL